MIPSCDRVPIPGSDWVPVVLSISADPDVDVATLYANLKEAPRGGYEYGFYYGRDESSMRRVLGKCTGGKFIANVTGLLSDTEYLFKAYVTNGQSEICTDVQTFMTLPKPQESDQPQEPDQPQNPDEPAEPDTPSKPVVNPEFAIQMTESNLTIFAQDIYVGVSGNVDYDVIIPEDASWVTCRDKSVDCCRLSVTLNNTEEVRICEVVFSCKESEKSYVLTLTQQAIEVYYAHFSHCYQSTYVTTLPDAEGISAADRVDENGNILKYVSDDWCYIYHSATKRTRIPVILHQNKTVNQRVEMVLVTAPFTDLGRTEKRTVLLFIVQHSYLDKIDFECEAVERRCVELWDANCDGVLTYGEAMEVKSATNAVFSGDDITSFIEFQLFREVTILTSYMFSETPIESIVLPPCVQHLPTGIFKNCSRLRDIDMTNIQTLSIESFMGCSSLKNVVLNNPSIPTRVFSGCTSLETCTIREKEDDTSQAVVGVEAFKDCTSLQELTLTSNITRILSSAFSGCTSLRAVYFVTADPPSVAADAFSGTGQDLRLYVPARVLSAYQAAWPQWVDIIVGY